MKKTLKRKKEKRNENTSRLKEYFLCVLFNLIIFTVLFFIAGFICLKTNLSRDNYYLTVLAVSILCSLSCGFSYCRKTGEKGILNGFISVIPATVIITVLSVILSENGITVKLPLTAAVMLLSGALGGITGVNIGR